MAVAGISDLLEAETFPFTNLAQAHSTTQSLTEMILHFFCKLKGVHGKQAEILRHARLARAGIDRLCAKRDGLLAAVPKLEHGFMNGGEQQRFAAWQTRETSKGRPGA